MQIAALEIRLPCTFVVTRMAPDVQVRMQAEGKLAEGKFKKYPNAVKAYGIIARYGLVHCQGAEQSFQLVLAACRH